MPMPNPIVVRPSRRDLLSGAGRAALAAALPGAWTNATAGAGGEPRDAIDWPSLGAVASARGVTLGCAISPVVHTDAAYAAVLLNEARLLVPEYAMTFHYIRQHPDRVDYSAGDEMLAYARAHRMPMHGQTLIWDYEQPAWMKRLAKSETIALFDRHIDETLAHWAPAAADGAMRTWTVVNEPFWPDAGQPGGFRTGAWYSALGPAYVERAFKRAMAAGPGLRLKLNEAQCERYDALGAKFRPRLLELLDRLLDAGVRVDAVGLQAHLQLHVAHDDVRFVEFLHQLAKRGVAIHLTELDVNDVEAVRDTSARDAAVAARYRDFLTAALSVPAVDTVIFWQLADRHSWYRGEWYLREAPRAHRRWPARPLPYDDALHRKPAWHAVRAALETRPLAR